MNERELGEALTRAGLGVERELDSWRDSVQLLAMLDAIARAAGGNAIVKIDGGRTDNVYTVVLSGGDDFFRKDGAALQPLLREAIGFYVDQTREQPLPR